MPSNERINKRKEKQREKDRKTKIAVWVILLVILIVMIIMKVCEIDFKNLQKSFSSGEVTASISTDYPYSLDNNSNFEVDVVNNKFALLTDSNVDVLNIQNAKKSYSFEHGYSSPVLSYAGNYLCVYDRGGTRLRLDTLSDNLYEMHFDRSLTSACVSNNGTVAYSVFGDSSKSKLVVMTKTEKKKAVLDINDGYITSVALNSNASKCAFVSVNSENGKFVSTVHIIRVSDSEEISKFEYSNSDILDLKFCSNDRVFVVGKDFLSILKSKDNQIEVFKKGSVSTLHYCYTNDNDLVINYNEYSNSQSTKIAYIKASGKIKTTITTEATPKYISTNSNRITALYSNNFCVYSLTNGKVKINELCDSNVESIHTISSKNYIQYGQYLDVVKIESER